MKKRRRRQLHLAAFLGGAILPQDQSENLKVNVEDSLFFHLGEIAALALQFGELRIESLGGVAAPRQIEPRLEIEEFLGAEIPQAAPDVVAVKGEAAFVEQF